MHELTVARSLHDWALAQLEALGRERLVAIELERDPMSCINTEALRFGFEAMSAGGPLAGVELVVNDTTSRYHCHHCGHVVRTEEPPVTCPSCGAATPRLAHDTGVRVVALELSE